MPDLPIIYTIRLDMQEDVTEEANLWNNTRHISDLLGSGFLSAVRFRSLKGEPEYLHLYELAQHRPPEHRSLQKRPQVRRLGARS